MKPVIIEMPKGTNKKIEMQEDGSFHVDRMLDVYVPFNYGFIPHTLAEDGDPEDIFVIEDTVRMPGSALNVRIIGRFECIDNGERDDKWVGVAQDYRPNIEFDLQAIQRYLSTYKLGFQIVQYVNEEQP